MQNSAEASLPAAAMRIKLSDDLSSEQGVTNDAGQRAAFYNKSLINLLLLLKGAKEQLQPALKYSCHTTSKLGTFNRNVANKQKGFY